MDVARDSLRTWIAALAQSADYVVDGFAVTDGGGLTADIAAGSAIGSGTYMARDAASNVSLDPSATNHIWASVDEDKPGGEVVFIVNTTGTAPSTPAAKLAEVATNSSAVTGVTDKRLYATHDKSIVLQNAKAYKALTTADVVRNLAKLTSSDEIEIGNASLPLRLLSDGTITHNGQRLAPTVITGFIRETTGDTGARYPPLAWNDTWFGETDPDTARTPMPAGTLQNLRVRTNKAIGSGRSITVELRKNGSSTGVAVTFNAGDAAGTEKTAAGPVTLAGGDDVNLYIRASGSSEMRAIGWSVEFA